MFIRHLRMPLLLLCALMAILPVDAGIVSMDDAKVTAVDFFSARGCERLSEPSKLQLAHTEVNSAGTPSFYVFNSVDGNGFIIIAASHDVPPVVGYSYDNTFNPDNVPAGAVEILKNVDRNKVSHTAYGYDRHRIVSKVSSSKNLTTALWSQEAPFNNLIPGHRLTGCVGVAMAIIMKYHNWPERGTGSVGDVSFDSEYDWANMRQDNYRYGYTESEAKAVATLMSHASQSILTDFGMSSSSAFDVRVPSALINHFSYDAGVSYKEGAEMDKADWDNLIISEIEAGRPVLYCGQDLTSGHAFVCDGYESDGVNPYIHVNWGWGGLANGYFSSGNMSPQASRLYDFNDQTTIVYNIKPATVTAEWSPIHLTSDGNQVGMTMDVTDLEAGAGFTVRAGALKNIMNEAFSGQMSVALFSGAGELKAHLSGEKGFSLSELQVRQFVDFECRVPSGVDIGADDVVRLATKARGADSWLPVIGDLITIGELPAKGNVIPYFNIDIPVSVEGAEIVVDEPRVIKGRDYSFKVAPLSADNVVSVKANGFILTPSASNVYEIKNVNSDQAIKIIVQNASEVVSKRALWVSAGGLSEIVGESESATITELTLFGTVNAEDFKFIRERMKLTRLDLSGVNILAVGSNPANAIPSKAFSGYGCLKQVVLPKNLTVLKSGCFNATGLTSIEIPASVATYEYNIFLNCSDLSKVILRRSNPAWINWCVFAGTPKTKLVVPVGSSQAYKNKENWKEFKDIVEENAAPVTSCSVVIQDMPGVKITPVTEGDEVAPGASYSFMVETDDTYGDAIMEVYANNVRLYPSQNGVYTAVVSSNTIIHTHFREPVPTGYASSWKLTGAGGGVGLVTDVVNVLPGKSFVVRANAVSIPSDDATQFYAAVLTDANGAIKEIISPVVANDYANYGDIAYNFSCQVKEASVKDGNSIRIATSYNKKIWHLVSAVDDNICDSLPAVGNPVRYHSVTMPETVNGAVIQGAVSQVVRGMPLTIKVTPVSVDDVVTIAVNGINKVVGQPVGNLSIPSVTDDLDITVQVNHAGSQEYTVVNVAEGELGAKIQQCPKRLKVIGVISLADFNALREHSTEITDLDLADVVIKDGGNIVDAIPSNAFVPDNVMAKSALSTIILPTGLKRIEDNAFYRCMNITSITLPASLTHIGNGAFTSCVRMNRIIALPEVPPTLGVNPFPNNSAQIVLEVPRGSETAYRNAYYWNDMILETSPVYFNIQIDPTRLFNFNKMNPISNIPYPEIETSVTIGLPNSTVSYNPVRRPGVAFKLYDNGSDVTGRSYFRYGQYGVKFDPYYNDPEVSLACPQDHRLDVVFYYSVDFVLPEGFSCSLVNVSPDNEWTDVDMSLFDSESTASPTLYKEGGNYGFVLTSESDSIETKVKVTSRVLTSPGASPEYSVVEEFLSPDESGVFMIANLQGDVRVEVSVVPAEGSVISVDNIGAIDEDDVKDLTTAGFSGMLDDEDFSIIRSIFGSLESMDLSGIDNESIPDHAFEDMANLNTVVLPDNVVSIGACAFKGCTGLESMTLNSVYSIGEGAFDGCVNMTELTVNTSMNPAGLESGIRAPRSVEIDGKSFQGINPNCLIFVADAGIASSIAGKSNIVLTEGGTRVAFTDISLTGGYPFNAPGSFRLGDKSIAYRATVCVAPVDLNSGWSGIVVPFAPSSVAVDGVECTFASSGNGSVSLYSFGMPDDEKLSQQSSMMPDVPYLVRVNGDNAGTAEVVFRTSGTADVDVYDVSLTPDDTDIVSVGKEFSLYGTYSGRNAVEGDYLLDESGEVFALHDASSEEVCRVVPFSVYARYNDVPQGDEIRIGDNKTSFVDTVQGFARDGLKISRDGSILIVESDRSRVMDIFNIAGVLVASLRLSPGQNFVTLPAGVYIVEGMKIMM